MQAARQYDTPLTAVVVTELCSSMQLQHTVSLNVNPVGASTGSA